MRGFEDLETGGGLRLERTRRGRRVYGSAQCGIGIYGGAQCGIGIYGSAQCGIGICGGAQCGIGILPRSRVLRVIKRIVPFPIRHKIPESPIVYWPNCKVAKRRGFPYVRILDGTIRLELRRVCLYNGG
jgi:hypothetical protein